MSPARAAPLALLALIAACADGGADTGAAAARPHKVGVAEAQFADAARARPLPARIWYPAVADAIEEDLGYERAFRGRAAPGAAPLPGPHPLVLLSHGDRGDKSNQSWLAEALAAHGHVVAAVDHWQNTRAHHTPEATVRVWERPQDLSALLSALLADPHWQPRVDPQRVAAAGHSSGGYTALALAGARYAPLQMAAYCAGTDAGPDCRLARGARFDQIDFTPAGQSYRDPRVRGVLALAPALGPGMDTDSLRAIAVPVAIVAARNDEILPFERHAAHYAGLIPGARLLTLPDGGHFVFMPRCTVPATVFTWFHEFDVCGRRHEADRGAAHALVAAAAVEFLGRALAPPAQRAAGPGAAP